MTRSDWRSPAAYKLDSAPFFSAGGKMGDTSVQKVKSEYSPKGKMGQKYLASGIHVSMRLWENEKPGEAKPATARDYETVGYVIGGRAELHLEGQIALLEPGDSWVVPKGASHTCPILDACARV